MIRVGQARTIRIAPTFRIEMQTKHKIRMQFEVHQRSPASDLAVTVKQNLALPSNGLLFAGIVWIKNVGARLRYTVLNQNFSCQLPKIIRPLSGNWFVPIPNERNFCAKFTQSRGQQSRHPQSQIAFLYRRAATHLKPALLHLCPFATEMTRIQRDLQTE